MGEVSHGGARRLVNRAGSPVIVDAVLRGVTLILYNASTTTIGSGDPVCGATASTAGSPSDISIPSWDAGFGNIAPMQPAIVPCTSSADGPVIGVALDTILPGRSGEVALHGSILCVKCGPVTGAALPLWAVKPAASGAASVDLTATPPATPGSILGVVLILPKDFLNPGLPIVNTGSSTFAGVLVSPN